MAKQTIDRGTGAGNGDGEVLYDAFGKCINNFTELYDATAVIPEAGDEHTAAGVLVYPSHVEQLYDYNLDNTLNYMQTKFAYDGMTWRLAMTTYDTDGNVTLMTATADITTPGAGVDGSWTRTLTYNAGNQVTDDGVWT